MSEDSTGYIRYNIDDNEYAGAADVVAKETELIKKRRGTDKDALQGVALSGGGIRAASFSLGVLQALAKNDKLERFDYLSTVSGGGYLGGALSWLWLGKWRDKTRCAEVEKPVVFGTGKTDFPYGSGKRHDNPVAAMDKHQASLMRHLRQHGNYLTPGRGLTALSFLSVILRSIVMGFLTVIVLTSVVFHVLHLVDAFGPTWLFVPEVEIGSCKGSFMLDVGLSAAAIYVAYLLLYSVLSICNKDMPYQGYLWRRWWEKSANIVLLFVVGTLVLSITEMSRCWLEGEVQLAGGLSAFIGSAVAWYFQKTEKTSVLKIIPTSLLMLAGILAMFLGLFVIADSIAYAVVDEFSDLVVHILIAAGLLLCAYLIPINKVSIHRYYRDRLMETFMPDACELVRGEDPYVAKQATTTGLHECMPDETNDGAVNRMPYHIINTNIILVESEIAKFRGRGGDNFILSPLYSGSNATGWKRTEKFADGSITLPTAVAISGAAANTDSGVAGTGPTMNPLLSALMSMFNLRLGYWVVNPDTGAQSDQKAIPNYLKPGFRGVIGRKKLNEKADFVQLSDGGHFENLAAYELLRRHCKVIVCCDGEQDKGFVYQSLANLIEKARIDFGVEIRLSSNDLEAMRYSQDDDGVLDYAEKCCVEAKILYPDGTEGLFIYIKTTLVDGLPADVVAYKKMNPDFPDETTVDQFFDEQQMEAYRLLGFHAGSSVAKVL